ncbi:MAG: cvaA [Rhizobacter sp.]|nr:cvaA [Rhizobacter sp.]
MTALFRSEALQARSHARLGTVFLAQPLGHHMAAWLAALLIALIAAFACFGSYTRKATVTGILSPAEGVLRTVSPGAGLMSEVGVREGQEVAAGDALFTISGERRSGSGATQQLIGEQLDKRRALLVRNAALARERHAERLRSADDRLGAIAGELEQLAKEAALLEGRERLGQAHLRRQEESVRTGYLSPAALELAQSEQLALQGQVQAIGRTRATLLRDRATAQAQRRDAELQYRIEASDVDASLAVLSQESTENDARARMVVVAPFNGTVTGVSAQVGQTVAAGTVLATLMRQNTPLVAHFYAPSRQAGFVEVGQTVRLRYAAYPYQKFGMGEGEVVEVSRSPYAPQELPAHVAAVLGTSSGASEPVYRISVRLSRQSVAAYGVDHSLKSGMVVEGDVLQDTRRLYEWVLEPVYAVSQKFGGK